MHMTKILVINKIQKPPSMCNEVEEKQMGNTEVEKTEVAEESIPLIKRKIDEIEVIKKPSVIEKRPQSKCNKCGRRTTVVTSYECRCKELFCSRHRFYDQHDCTYDYKKEARDKLKVENPKVIKNGVRETILE